MLTFINTTVNIKGEDGFFVSYESETISRKAKNCTITNFTEGQILAMIKKIRTLVKTTIMQNHLDLNNMLLNYYKWRQTSTVKDSVPANDLKWLSSAIKFIGFLKRNFFDQWKSYCKKRVIYALKTCRVTKLYTPLIRIMQNWSIIVFTVVWTWVTFYAICN